jgi:hypothetical protein
MVNMEDWAAFAAAAHAMYTTAPNKVRREK